MLSFKQTTSWSNDLYVTSKFFTTLILYTLNYKVILSTTGKGRVRKVCNTRLVLTLCLSLWTAARSDLCCLYHYRSKSSQASSTASPSPSYHSGFKILLLALKALNLAPLYLSELLHIHTLPHSQNLFCHPAHNNISPFDNHRVSSFRPLSPITLELSLTKHSD